MKDKLKYIAEVIGLYIPLIVLIWCILTLIIKITITS